ncbi:ribbon-helix-helix domain-containing protein [Profundibacter sp.]
MESVLVKLPATTLEALNRIARQEDVSVGQIIRNALNRDFRRREKAKKPVRADERLVAPLRALLADDFAYAESWTDLQNRLAGKGYSLREAGGGLCLHRQNGEQICKGSELGYGYASLMRKFQRPFPGHRHKWLSDRMLGTGT